MDRRTALYTAGAVGGACLAGCLTREPDAPPEEGEEEDENRDEGELRVVAEESFVRPEESPGRWLKAAFEEEYEDADIVWVSPEAGIDLYLQQARQGVPIGEDVYLGLTPTDLARVDEGATEDERGVATDAGSETAPADDGGDGAADEGTANEDAAEDGVEDEDAAEGDDVGLFVPLDLDRLSRSDRVRDEFGFGDPDGRALSVSVDFGCLLYDGTSVTPPESLDELLDETYRNDLVTQRPTSGEPGRSFGYWTIHEYGMAGSLEYWAALRDNGLRLFDDWESSYDAFLDGEAPLLVGRVSDRIATALIGREPDRQQVIYPDDTGYVLPWGAAIFEDTARSELAYQFVDFLLSSAVQTELVARTGRFPAVGDEQLDLPARFLEYAIEPRTPISLSHEELRAVQTGWFDEWTDAVGER